MTDLDQGSKRCISHWLAALAAEYCRDDRLYEAEVIRDAFVAAYPDFDMTVTEASGLWSLYSDGFAAGWLHFSADDVEHLASWIFNKENSTILKAAA